MDSVENQEKRTETLPEVCPICGNAGMSSIVSHRGLFVRLNCSVCNLKWDRWLGLASSQWDLRDSKFAARFPND